MQVELERVLRLAHRRELVAPFAVVALVVRVERFHLPYGADQRALRRVERRPRHIRSTSDGSRPSAR